jgi:hypothetical protein
LFSSVKQMEHTECNPKITASPSSMGPPAHLATSWAGQRPFDDFGKIYELWIKKWENGEENNFDNSLHGSQTLFSVEMTHRSSIAIHRVRSGVQHALRNRLLQKASRELTEYCEDDRIHPGLRVPKAFSGHLMLCHLRGASKLL